MERDASNSGAVAETGVGAPMLGARGGLGWVWPLMVGVVGFVVVHPFDGPLAARLSAWGQGLPGDVRREWFAWQQYGQGMTLIVVAAAVWLLDPARRRRLLDLGLAALICQIVSTGGKMLVGRPRPRTYFNDPWTFLTPWGEYPIPMKDGSFKLVHAWDRAGGATTDLWSMPSSHTLFAAMVSVFLATLYPRLRWVVAALTLGVACGRVMFDAHWPTDVVVGGAAGWLVGMLVVPRHAGVRLVDWVWRRAVDRSARPAYRAVGAREREETGPAGEVEGAAPRRAR